MEHTIAMEDRYTAGFLSGLAASLIGTAFEFALVKRLHFGQLSFLRFAALSLFFTAPSTPAEYVITFLLHTIFCGLMGAIFAYFLKAVTPRHDFVKGNSLRRERRLDHLDRDVPHRGQAERSSAENVAASFLCAIVYGLVLACVYRRIGPREAG